MSRNTRIVLLYYSGTLLDLIGNIPGCSPASFLCIELVIVLCPSFVQMHISC
jgi:hypothetical protein